MTDRDDLAALVDAAMDDLDEFYGPGTYATGDRIVNEIIARWRLVPVGEGCVGRDHQWQVGAPTCTRCGYVSDQHRAADELTRHDMDAGIYDDCTCAGREQRPHRRSYEGRADNHDQAEE